MMNATASAEPKNVRPILGHARRAKSAKAVHKALKANEGKKYSIKSIARDTGMSWRGVHNVLDHLVAAGVIRRDQKLRHIDTNSYYVLKDL